MATQKKNAGCELARSSSMRCLPYQELMTLAENGPTMPATIPILTNQYRERVCESSYSFKCPIRTLYYNAEAAKRAKEQLRGV